MIPKQNYLHTHKKIHLVLKAVSMINNHETFGFTLFKYAQGGLVRVVNQEPQID